MRTITHRLQFQGITRRAKVATLRTGHGHPRTRHQRTSSATRTRSLNWRTNGSRRAASSKPDSGSASRKQRVPRFASPHERRPPCCAASEHKLRAFVCACGGKARSRPQQPHALSLTPSKRRPLVERSPSRLPHEAASKRGSVARRRERQSRYSPSPSFVPRPRRAFVSRHRLETGKRRKPARRLAFVTRSLLPNFGVGASSDTE